MLRNSDATTAISDREHRVERQVLGDERVAGRAREQRRFAEDRDDDRVGDHAGEDGRDQRLGLEVVAVQHLGREQRGAERRSEDGRHAGGDARQHEDASLARADLEREPDRRAERPAHLHGRALAPARPAAAQGEDRRERFHPDDATPDDAALMVERVNHRVAAAAPRLRREQADQARQQRARGREGAG